MLQSCTLKRKYDKIATFGNDLAGGASFDNKSMSWCIKEFKENNNIRIMNNPTVMKRLRRECQLLKLHFQNDNSLNYSWTS